MIYPLKMRLGRIQLPGFQDFDRRGREREARSSTRHFLLQNQSLDFLEKKFETFFLPVSVTGFRCLWQISNRIFFLSLRLNWINARLPRLIFRLFCLMKPFLYSVYLTLVLGEENILLHTPSVVRFCRHFFSKIRNLPTKVFYM